MPTGSIPPALRSSPLTARRVSRRAVLASAAGAGLALIGAVAGVSRLREEVRPTPTEQAALDPVNSAGPGARPATAPPPAASPGPARLTSTRVAGASRLLRELEGDRAIVASLRLPLFGVGERDVPRLLAGEVVDWLEVGSPVSLPVEPLALAGQVPPGMAPLATFAGYDELASELWRRPGGVAVVPVEQVDFRVNVLAIDGHDPVRGQIDGEKPVIRIGVVGDIVPGRNVHHKMVFYGDFTRPFHNVAAELSSYDLTIANLEGNLSATITPPADRHTFSFISSPAMLDGFKLAGIDAVSLANNHSTWNSAGWGVSALLDTLDALDAAGVGRFGAGRTLDEARAPWVAEVNGRRIAVIGIDGVTANEAPREPDATVYNTWLGAPNYAGAGPSQPGTNPYITDQFLGDIRALAATYDIVIPYFHLGREYVSLPPRWAVEGARAAIDAGATFVVTNHPHVVQCMEIHAGRPIVYSVGNFIFDQMFSAEVRQGLILEVAVQGNRVVGLRCRGVEIEDFHQPRLMTAGEHAALMDRFWDATDRLAARR